MSYNGPVFDLSKDHREGADRTVITSNQAPKPLGAYSLGISVSPGKLVFIAGQVGVDSNGNLVGKGDAAAQTRQALENIGHVLAAAGAGFSDVVEFTTYVVGRSSIRGYLDGRGQVYPDIYPDGEFPTNTLLVAAGLVNEDLLVEIKAVAALP